MSARITRKRHAPLQDDLRRVVDSLPGLVWTSLPDGHVDFLNQPWCDYTGLSLDKACGWGWNAAIYPQHLPALLYYSPSILTSGEPGEMEARMRRFDGKHRWFLFRASPSRDASGKVVRWYGTNTDIEARKVAEEALREGELHFRLILDNIPGLVSTRAATGAPEFVNHQMLEFFGQSLEQLPDWSSLIHPDDRERVVSLWRRSVDTGRPYDVEHRARRADGVFRWLHARGQALRDADGRVVRWCNMLTDIDDRKHVEEALRTSELNLRAIVDAIPQFIAVIDAEGGVLYANQLLLQYTGWTLEDLKTSDFPAMILHPDDFERLRDERQKALARGAPFELELRARRNDGQYRWFLVRYNPLRDELENVLRWYASATDIDDRKRAEDRLQLLLDVTNQVVSNLQLRDLLRAISSSVRRVMQCDVVSVCFPDSEMQRLQTFVIDFPDSKGFIREDLIPIEGSLGGFVFRTGKPWAGNASDLLRLGIRNDPAMAEGLKTGCVLPLVSRNGVLGVLTLGRREDNSFSQVDIGFLTQVANQVAIAVENATAYRQIEGARAELEKAFEEIKDLKDRLQDENVALREQIDQSLMFEELVGVSPALRAVLSRVSKVAPTDSTVLLTGETGTGKELIARALHKRSRRSS